MGKVAVLQSEVANLRKVAFWHNLSALMAHERHLLPPWQVL